MTERSYTVNELDALRHAVEQKWLFGSYGQSDCFGPSRSWQGAEKEQAVEAIVRTHMLAGHTAEDLYASERSADNP